MVMMTAGDQGFPDLKMRRAIVFVDIVDINKAVMIKCRPRLTRLPNNLIKKFNGTYFAILTDKTFVNGFFFHFFFIRIIFMLF